MAIPVLNAGQAQELDRLTFLSEPVTSLDLMERASWQLSNALLNNTTSGSSFHFICGPGNNGGDGLCMARILYGRGYKVRVSLVYDGKTPSPQHLINRALLAAIPCVQITEIYDITDLNLKTTDTECLVDCMFGSGLNSALHGLFAQIATAMNHVAATQTVIAIDIPSGLLETGNDLEQAFVKAHLTLCIQYPKKQLLYNHNKIVFELVNIGLIKPETGFTNTFYLDPLRSKSFVEDLLPPPDAFAHKGTRGHCLLIGGLSGKNGAIVMAARSCLEHGAGLVTVMSDSATQNFLAPIPEVMFRPVDELETLNPSTYACIAIGPGLGTNHKDILLTLLSRLNEFKGVLIMDADALNLLSANPHWWELIPENTVLTPHPAELKRLFDSYENEAAQFVALKEIVAQRKIILVAKDKYTCIYEPNGTVYINGTGSDKLAQGGSGDKLTGRIAAYAAQLKNALNASLLGVYRV